MGTLLPVVLTISSRATKILNQEPAWVPKNYYSCDNSLCAHLQWRNDRIPACSFGTFETKMFVNIDCSQKIYAAKSKQTSTLLEIQNSNKSNFETRESSFELIYLSICLLFLSINGLLEMWLCLLTLYLKSLNGSQKFS